MKEFNKVAKTFFFCIGNILLFLHTVLCSGHVVAKDPHSCHGDDIRSAWRASCGNVAFMPCDHRATLAEGTRFEICLAGFNQQKLVYDMQQR